MAKDIKSHINLASQGEHEFFLGISFENGNSECLRLQEVRLRPGGGDKPYPLPLKLLTWYTEHAPAGREITRDDNNQQNEAALYISLVDLREQIETFSLKSPFILEIEISERDRNDESLMRSDRGHLTIEVHLYDGPQVGCRLNVTPLVEPGTSLKFPENCAAAGRFDLAKIALKADEGPLDPRTDKRVILCDLALPEKLQHLRHSLIERLELYSTEKKIPARYVRDTHHYQEQYHAQPLDQKTDFPDGVAVFGPLLPMAPKERGSPLTLSLNAPPHDPLWQDIKALQQAGNNRPFSLELILTLPVPGGNVVSRQPLSLLLDEGNWLIITDGAARGRPAIIPLGGPARAQKTGAAATKETPTYTLRFPVLTSEPPTSALISVQYFGDVSTENPVNIALTPSKKDSAFVTIKPEVIELTSSARQMLLLNSFAKNKKQKNQRNQFRLKCFWPKSQASELASLTIERRKQRPRPAAAIDIGSKSITMAERQGDHIIALPLGQLAPSFYLHEKCLPSTIALSSGAPGSGSDEAELHENNWRAEQAPLSFGYNQLPWQQGGIAKRLEHHHRHYDIAVPAGDRTAENRISHKNLKRLFTSSVSIETSRSGDLALKRTAEPEAASSPLALARNIEPTRLMADCLDELYGFYGDQLALTGEALMQSEAIEQNSKTEAAEEQPLHERQSGLDATLVLTHPGHLSQTGCERYQAAGGAAIANYEQGSFRQFNELADFLGFQSEAEASARVTLVRETEAAAYHCLRQLAHREHPARARNVRLIQLDLGAAHLGIGAFTAWLGETEVLLEQSHASVTMPLGARALELALTKEVAAILEAALNSSGELKQQASLPQSLEELDEADSARPQSPHHSRWLKSLRQALTTAETQKSKAAARRKETDLKICLARSKGEGWPLSLAETAEASEQPQTLWQGLNGEQIILLQQSASEDWQLELHLSTRSLAERTGPLSTWLAFCGEFLPTMLAGCFPAEEGRAELLISVTGGTSLFGPLHDNIEKTAKRLGCRLVFVPADYAEAATACVTGALDLIMHQAKPPHRNVSPNLLLAPQTGEQPAAADLAAIADHGNLIVIGEESASGQLPAGTKAVQLIETVPGLGALMQGNPAALNCRYYMEDLDRARESQWITAEQQWSEWLSQCYQVALNMPLSAPAEEEAEGEAEAEKANPAPTGPEWQFHALKEHEASFTIGSHSYVIYTGLSNAAL